MKRFSLLLCTAVCFVVLGCSKRPADGEYTFHLLTTNDIHGTWFPHTYTDGNVRKSLASVSYIVEQFRDSCGKENVILVDAGDCLQGDNAAYYFNYVDTAAAHIFPRIIAQMGYDAIAVGNHDIETGHAVYDRVTAELKGYGIPFLAGNAIKNSATYTFEERYFESYKIIERSGFKIAILGYSNPNIKGWLAEELWSGMHFVSLLPLVQLDVDKVIAKHKPDVVIVAVHSGTGDGKGNVLESQGLELFNTLKGVDFLVCSHDHRPYIAEKEDICLINSGSHARNVGHGTIKLTVKGGKVVAKELMAENIPTKTEELDSTIYENFKAEYEAVKAFTMAEVGSLDADMNTRDAFKGMCDYVNLVHTVGMEASGAEISIAAPLSYNKSIKAGKLVYNDLFTIYPFENQLYVIKMTGNEIKQFLEYSYDGWIVSDNPAHVLKIEHKDDSRTGQKGWSFVERSYNFDSAAGINYTVDVTKPLGQRISITSMADGTPFESEREYNVAMTSYRASGGGGLLIKAGIEPNMVEERIVEKYPEYRELIYQYILKHKELTHSLISDGSKIGSWSFVPAAKQATIERDMQLLFE